MEAYALIAREDIAATLAANTRQPAPARTGPPSSPAQPPMLQTQTTAPAGPGQQATPDLAGALGLPAHGWRGLPSQFTPHTGFPAVRTPYSSLPYTPSQLQAPTPALGGLMGTGRGSQHVQGAACDGRQGVGEEEVVFVEDRPNKHVSDW